MKKKIVCILVMLFIITSSIMAQGEVYFQQSNMNGLKLLKKVELDCNGNAIIPDDETIILLHEAGSYHRYTSDTCSEIFPAKSFEGEKAPYRYRLGELYGLISPEGNILVEAQWDSFNGFRVINGGKAEKGDLYYHVDYEGNMIPEKGADRMELFVDGSYKYSIGGDIYEYNHLGMLEVHYTMDADWNRIVLDVYIGGEKVNNPIVQDINTINERVVAYCHNGKWGLMDYAQTILAPEKWDWIDWYLNDGLYWALNDKCYGIITEKGEVVLPFQYQYWSPINDEQAVFEYDQSNGGFDIVDAQGRVTVTLPKGYGVDAVEKPYIRYRHEPTHTWGYMNNKGEVLCTVEDAWKTGEERLQTGGRGIGVYNSLTELYGTVYPEKGLVIDAP